MTDANTGIVRGHDGMAIVAMGVVRRNPTLKIVVGLNIVKLASHMRSANGADAHTAIGNLPAHTASVAMDAGKTNPTHLTAPGQIRQSSGEHLAAIEAPGKLCSRAGKRSVFLSIGLEGRQVWFPFAAGT